MPKTINPYKMFVGSFVPNWLMERKEISQGAKLCYARLAQFAGEDGKCFPSLPKLAKCLGVSQQQVSKYLRQLIEKKLIGKVRRGLGKTNMYVFFAHKWLIQDENFRSGTDENFSSYQSNNFSSDKENQYKENQLREKKPCVSDETPTENSSSPAPTKILIDYYYSEFQKKFGSVPVDFSGPIAGATLKRLLSYLSEEKIREYIDGFLCSGGFYEKGGYKITLLPAYIQSSIVKDAEPDIFAGAL